MKVHFSHTKDYFKPILFASLIGHFALVGGGSYFFNSPQVSVVNALSSVEVELVEQQISFQPNPIVEEIIQIKASDVVEEIVERVEENVPIENTVEPNKNLPDIKGLESMQKESVLSPGAYTETEPLYFENPAPLYPRIAKKRGWEGTVIMEVIVKENGVVDKVLLLKSSGYKILDKEALETVKTWKFFPAKTGDMAFSSTVSVPVKFQLIN